MPAADGAAPARSTAPRLEVREFRRRFDAAWKVAAQWRSLLEDAFDYAMPNRSLYSNTNPGQKKADKVFDSTAVNSAISGANRIQQDLMPAFKKWIKLTPGPMIPEHLREGLALKLDEVTDRLFAFIHASNFDTSINETLLDLMVGTGCMLCIDGGTLKPLNFVPVSISEVALEAGPWGGVSGVYRKHRVAVRNIKAQWRDAKLSEELERLVKDKPDTEVDLQEGTYFATATDGSAATAWYYDVVHGSGQEGARIVERTYAINPWVTPRWYKLPGEVFGRGPVILALPDIKTLNKIVELVLRNAALAISGVYTGVDDGVLNPATAQIIPGAIIPVASNAGGARGASLAPLLTGGKFDVAALEIDDLRMTVKRMLYDRQLPPDAGPVRSATEIIERVKELAREVGSLGRFYGELIVPVVQNALHILNLRGLVPAVRIDGMAVQVQVVSPLAQEQNISDVEIVVRWLSILSALGKELVMMTAKTEDLGKWMGEKLGVPNELIRSTNERKSIMNDITESAGAEIAKAGGSNVVPLGVGVPYQNVQTAGAAAGVAPFSRMAA